jgi:lipopolysaccharide export system protein LptA
MGAAVLTAVLGMAEPAAAQGPTRDTGRAATKPRNDRSQPVTVDADRMERFGKESLIVFIGNVVARQDTSVQYADRMELYLDEKGDRVLRAVSTGNVRIVTLDCKMGTAQRAEYDDLEQRIVLTGNARVWQDANVVTGETITIFLSQDHSIVQGGKQERVKAIFYPKDDKRDGAAAAAPGPTKRPSATCEN